MSLSHPFFDMITFMFGDLVENEVGPPPISKIMRDF